MGLASKNNQREGIRWLKRAQESADFQYNSAPYELGIMHLAGYGDEIFKDESYAAQLLTQAAELGHPQANYLMGQAYENGLYACPRDAALSADCRLSTSCSPVTGPDKPEKTPDSTGLTARDSASPWASAIERRVPDVPGR